MMTTFIETLRQKASTTNTIIVFPESLDTRILQAAQFLHQNKLCTPLLIGSQPQIAQAAHNAGVNIEGIQIRDPAHDADYQPYVQQLVQLRQQKGMTQEEAQKLILNPVYFGTMMIKNGKAHGLVSGSTHSTAETLRPALQIIKTKEGISLASSFFFMVFEDGRLFLFSDCGVNINPTAQQLAEITKSTVHSAQEFGIQPQVALLSFSTKGSAKHELSDKVIQATQLVQQMNLGVPIDGELQLDAAIVPEIAQSKAPNSPVNGNANVLIFPDLNAGNIGYKLTERLAGAHALGPIMQGLGKPVNDLSRGCSADDVINVACITAIQAGVQKAQAPQQSNVQQQVPQQQASQQQQNTAQPAVQVQPAQQNQQPSQSAQQNGNSWMDNLKKLKDDSSHSENGDSSPNEEQPATQNP